MHGTEQFILKSEKKHIIVIDIIITSIYSHFGFRKARTGNNWLKNVALLKAK